MNKIKFFLITLLSVSLLTCERDDLCPETTPTSPSMVIGFFNNDVQESPKTVFDLTVFGIVAGSAVNGISYGDTDSIILPLKTDADVTQFRLFKDSVIDANGNVTDGNPDTISISYTREDIYVSRACGYKTIFKNVVITLVPDTDNWIQFTQPLNDNLTIEDELTTHYFFYH